jgi:hypothetical protein
LIKSWPWQRIDDYDQQKQRIDDYDQQNMCIYFHQRGDGRGWEGVGEPGGDGRVWNKRGAGRGWEGVGEPGGECSCGNFLILNLFGGPLFHIFCNDQFYHL